MLVGSRLRWSANPDYFRMEFYGLAYNTSVPLGALCDPSPLAGLQGPMSNVTDQRSFSLLYSLPTKLLRPYLDPLTVQRILSFVLYASTLLFLGLAASLLGVRLSLVLFLIAYFGASEQLLSYVFEYKLTLSSTAWLALAISLFTACMAWFARRWEHNILLLALIPVVSVLAYETYCVSRPLALVYWGMALLLVLRSSPGRKPLAVFLTSTLLCCLAFHLMHPGVRLDQTLFEGRTESIVTPEGKISNNWQKVVMTRLSEISALSEWPNHSLFVSESPREAGWMEIWIALAVVSLIVAMLCLRRSNAPAREFLISQRWNFALVLVLTATGFAVPLFSTTFLRGHRFFGLYMGSTLLTVLLAEAAARSGKKYLTWSLPAIALAATVVTLAHQVPLIADYTFTSNESNNDAHELRMLVSDLGKLEVPPSAASGQSPDVLYVCDKRDPSIWEHAWNAALYLSDLGCRLHAGRTVWLGEGCDCRMKPYMEDPSICILRTQSEDKNNFELVRISGQGGGK